MFVRVVISYLVITGLPYSRSTAEETVFLVDGRPASIQERRGHWREGEGFLEATGKDSRLIGGEGIGAGDFTVSVRLTLVNMKRSAAAIKLGDSYFGFEGSHGKIFLTGPLFDKASGLPIGDPSEFIRDSVPFTLVIRRKGRQLSFHIDEKLVHERAIADKKIGAIALLPWRATMRVEQFSASGNLDKKLAVPTKPKLYVMKQITGLDKIALLPPKKGNPRNSEGDFIQLADGRLMFVYTHFYGGGGDHSAARLVSRSSSDGGKTWTKDDVLVVEREGDMNVMSVSLLRLQNDDIAMFYLRKNSITDCRPLMRISKDEGNTWSNPRLCIEKEGYNVLNNDRALQLKNGRIILPVSLHNTPAQKKFDGRGVISCYFSDDGGKTWQQSQTVQKGTGVMLQEPGIIELKDGQLMMFCRTSQGSQFVAFSKDNGDTWSLFKPSNIISPRSPATIERIPKTGDLLLVWNNHNKVAPTYRGKRTPFNLAISKDEGKTWVSVKTLEDDPNGWYCYTAMAFVGEHVLLGHCAGDRRTGGLNTTQITRIPLGWIYGKEK